MMHDVMSFVVFFVIGVTTAQGQAQLGNESVSHVLKYDVVSIKRAKFPLEFKGAMDARNETHLVNTLKGLIAYAFGMRPEFVFCDINWCDSTLFDIHAKVAESDVQSFQELSSDQRAELFREVLRERFLVVLRKEVRWVKVYDLIRDGGPARLTDLHRDTVLAQSSGVGRPPDGVMKFKGNEIKAYAVGMPALARTLSDVFSESIERPVVDKTGLLGSYDFELKWSSEGIQSGHSKRTSESEAIASNATENDISVFTALREQLGLKLLPARELTEVVVVQTAQIAGND